jgi:hypothetical protein
MAEAFAAPNSARLQSRRSAQISLKSAFFTVDNPVLALPQLAHAEPWTGRTTS